MYCIDHFVVSALTHLKSADRDLKSYERYLAELKNTEMREALRLKDAEKVTKSLTVCVEKVESFLEVLYESDNYYNLPRI